MDDTGLVIFGMFGVMLLALMIADTGRQDDDG
jgi:hypothetical protein